MSAVSSLTTLFLGMAILLVSDSLQAAGTNATNSSAPPNFPGYTFTTIAGNPGVSGTNDGVGTNATFNSPQAVAVDSNGVLYVADTGNNTIRQIDTNGNVTTIAGTAGTNGYNDAQGTNALFNSPEGIALDTNGLIYVADASNNVIRKIDFSGNVTTFAGVDPVNFTNYYPTNYYTVTTPISSQLYAPVAPGNFGIPVGLCFGPAGQLYVTQKTGGSYYAGGEVSFVTSDGTIVTYTGFAANGLFSTTHFAELITGITYSKDGSFYFVSRGVTNNSFVEKLDQFHGTPLVGNAFQCGNADGFGTNALLNQPMGIGADQFGDLFVSDSGNNSIRMIFPGSTNNLITTLSLRNGFGSNAPNTPGSSDGVGTNASFNAPSGLAVAPSGVIYIADAGNHTIRMGTPPAPATRLTQTLLKGMSPSAKVKVGDHLVFNVTYSSGLPPVLSTSDNNVAAVVSGSSTVTFTTVGSATITAAQPGNVFYQSLPSSLTKITVGKGNHSIFFGSITNNLVVGGPQINFIPCYDQQSGLPVTLTSSDTNVITCTNSYGNATFTIVGAGIATITASQTNPLVNYLPASPVHHVLKVAKGMQYISFTLGSGTLSKGTKVGLSATANPSNLPVKFTSGNPRVISISGTNATAVGSGTTTIVASQPGDKNYQQATRVTNSVFVY